MELLILIAILGYIAIHLLQSDEIRDRLAEHERVNKPTPITSFDELFDEPIQPSKEVTWESRQEYLHSPEWNSKRKERLKMDNYRCFTCNDDVPLEVHHITYKHLYNEPMSDLVSLCRECHQETHRIHGYRVPPFTPTRKK